MWDKLKAIKRKKNGLDLNEISFHSDSIKTYLNFPQSINEQATIIIS